MAALTVMYLYIMYCTSLINLSFLLQGCMFLWWCWKEQRFLQRRRAFNQNATHARGSARDAKVNSTRAFINPHLTSKRHRHLPVWLQNIWRTCVVLTDLYLMTFNLYSISFPPTNWMQRAEKINKAHYCLVAMLKEEEEEQQQQILCL